MHAMNPNTTQTSRRFASTRENGWRTCMLALTPVVLAASVVVAAHAKSIHPRGSGGFPMEGNS